MPTTSQIRLLPPADEDLFEDLCRDLWALIWKDPDAQRNGRKGQSQCGVDVFGIPEEQDQYEGVQAKAYAEPLTEKHIQHEFDEAKKFNPPLRKLTIATTAPRDAKGQEYVRQLNLAQRKAKLYSVVLLGWDDIKRLVQDHMAASRPDLMEKYFGLTTSIVPVQEALDQAVVQIQGHHAALMTRLDVATELSSQEHYHQELNYARSLINSFKPEQALGYIQDCRERFWHTAQANTRYRILHYTGCALYMLGRRQEAGHEFIQALQYNPDDETALEYTALGFYLEGDLGNARLHAERAIERNLGNTKAYATLLQTADPSLSLTEILARVPGRYHTHPDVANTLAYLARQRGNLQDAEKWARTAITHDTENWCDLHGLLGEILFEQATGPYLVPGMYQRTNQTQAQLTEAVTEFSTAWERIAGTELQKSRVSWLANRAMAQHMLGNREEAIRDMDEALRLAPHNLDFVQRRALLAHEQGDIPRTIQLLRGTLPCMEQPNIYLLLASVLTETGSEADMAEAEKLLDELLASIPPPSVVEDAHRLKMLIAVEQEDWATAEALHSAMREADPDNIEVLVDGARLARLQDNRPQSIVLLSEAERKLTAQTPMRHRHALAVEWYALQEFKQAVRLYEQLANREANSPFTRKLLHCYYQAGDFVKALELGQHLIELYGPLPTVSEMVTAIYELVDNLPKARQVAEQYLERFPHDFSMRLRLALVCLRARDPAGIDAFLNTLIDTEELTLEECIRVARLYAYRERVNEALMIAYEARRKYMEDSNAHLFYVTLFFSTEHNQRQEALDVSIVGLDTAVCIKDETGKEEWYIIEQRKDRKAPYELAPEHPLAVKLMHKKAGEQVILKESPYSTDTGVICGVQSKFVHAIQESMRTFERMFPDTPGLWNVKFALTSDDPDAEPDFQPFFDMITEQHEYGLQVEQLYREGQITLGSFAKWTGDNVLVTWSRAMQKSEVGVRCSHGNPQDLQVAQALLSSDTLLVVDLISLFTLYGLDSRDGLTAHIGPFGIAQSSVDVIHELLIRQRDSRSEGHMVVGKDGEDFVRQEITQQEIQHNVTYLEELLDWIDVHCTVLPVTAALSYSQAYREHLDDLMGPSFVDTVLIASEKGKCLYSDDERLRAFARGEFTQESVWTQALLAKALTDNAIDEEAYNKDVIRLVTSNYRYIHISASVLVAAARQSNWRPNYPFSKVVQVLSGVNSDQASALVIVTETAYRLWREHLMDHQRSFIVQSLLTHLCFGRSRREVLEQLIPLIQHRFRYISLQSDQVMAEIKAWIQAHPF